MYITYAEYVQNGGKAQESDFNRLETLASKRLDYWTQNRITESDGDVKLCMTIIIDQMDDDQNGEQDVSSVSNDGVSMSFVDAKTSDQKWSDVYDRVVEILPIELVSLCV